VSVSPDLIFPRIRVRPKPLTLSRFSPRFLGCVDFSEVYFVFSSVSAGWKWQLEDKRHAAIFCALVLMDFVRKLHNFYALLLLHAVATYTKTVNLCQSHSSFCEDFALIFI